MADFTLTLKDSYGRTIAKTDDSGGKKVDIIGTKTKTAIGGKDCTRVVAKTTDETTGEEEVATGYVEDEELEEWYEETVSIPANFAGLEAAMVPTRLRDQLFEISEVVEGDDYVEITALHIFYRQRQNSTTWEPGKTTKYSGAAACRNVMQNVLFDTGFYVGSDSTDQILGDELDYARKNIVECFLNPESGICAKYKLSLIRDNDVFYCLKNVGFDRGFVVQSGKNMLGVQRTENIENIITRVAPLGRDADGNLVWMNYEGSNYVDSSHIGEYASPRLEILQTDIQVGRDGVTAENIHEKLRQKALARFSEDEVDIPEVTMTIEFISLGDTEEYQQYRDLDRVYLYDILHIKDETRGYSYGAQVIGVRHNILTGRLESCTIGTPQPWDGVRKVAVWRIPEIDGGLIRQNSIRAGKFMEGAIKEDDIAAGAVSGEKFNTDAQSAIRSLSLEQLRVESDDGIIHTLFEVTKGQIHSEIEDRSSQLRSQITQTASQIRTELENTASGIYSSITQEASQIRSEVHNATSSLYSAITQTESQIRSEVANTASGLYSKITQEASQIRSEVSNAVSGLSSSITQTASQIRSEVNNAASGLHSEILQEASQIRLYVKSADHAAEIVTRINQSTGEGEIKLNADKVYIGNEKSTTVISGKLNASDVTADYIKGKIASIANIIMNAVAVTGALACSGRVSADTIAGATLNVGGNSCTDLIKDASVSGNTLTLTKLSGGTVTFSKATTLSGAWSGSDFTVTASPQGTTITESFSTDKGAGEGSGGGLVTLDSFSSHKAYAIIKAQRLGSGNGILYRIVADATSEYNSGSTAGYNSAHLTGSWSGNTYTANKINSGSANSVSTTVTAGIYYTAATHKYTAQAVADGNTIDSDTGGTEAYDAGYNAGYNAALSDAGVPDGGTVYTAAGYKYIMWDAPVSGANQYYNCCYSVSSHALTKKT